MICTYHQTIKAIKIGPDVLTIWHTWEKNTWLTDPQKVGNCTGLTYFNPIPGTGRAWQYFDLGIHRPQLDIIYTPRSYLHSSPREPEMVCNATQINLQETEGEFWEIYHPQMVQTKTHQLYRLFSICRFWFVNYCI